MKKLENNLKGKDFVEIIYFISHLDTYLPDYYPPRLLPEHFDSQYSLQEILGKMKNYEMALKNKDIDFTSHPLLNETNITNENVLHLIERVLTALKEYFGDIPPSTAFSVV